MSFKITKIKNNISIERTIMAPKKQKLLSENLTRTTLIAATKLTIENALKESVKDVLQKEEFF